MSASNEVECSLCGRDLEGPPPEGCETCHGNAQVQPRAYTLSQRNSGQGPKEDRYGADGGLQPASSPLVVGGAIGHPGLRQN